MNLTIPKDSLNRALRRVQGAVASRAALPIMSCVLLRTAGDDAIEVVATNHDLQISHKEPASVVGPGSVALPIVGLSRFVSEFPPSDIEIIVDTKFKTTLRAGAKHGAVSGLSGRDFSEFKLETGRSFTMDQSDLKSALRCTLIAVSTDETRHVLNGVFFEIKDGKLSIVSTSGTQLSRAEFEKDGDDLAAILPTRAAAELMRLLDDKGEASLLFGSNTAEFTIGNTVMTSKLIAMAYPSYRIVMPKSSSHRVEINREELLSSIRLANAVQVAENSFLKIILTFKDNRVTVESSQPSSDAGDSIAIRYAGPEVRIAFSPEKVLSILGALDNDDIAIEFTDALSALVFRVGNFYGLVMPCMS